MHSSFVQWTKQRLFQTVLGHVHQRLLEYFIDLPGSLSFGGFLDSVELKDVCLDLFKINAEFYALGYPLRLCYGHIGKMKLSVRCASSCNPLASNRNSFAMSCCFV